VITEVTGEEVNCQAAISHFCFVGASISRKVPEPNALPQRAIISQSRMISTTFQENTP
jgi:hypothetical protein